MLKGEDLPSAGRHLAETKKGTHLMKSGVAMWEITGREVSELRKPPLPPL